MNKKLLIVIIILIPIMIISFQKETNFIMPKNIKNISQKKTVKVDIGGNIYEVDYEEYIIGVVAGEMPALFEEEALKAQAVASRTYLIKSLENKEIIKGTTDDQVYLTKKQMKEKWGNKYELYYEKIKKAVLSTDNKIMYYLGNIIIPYYYSMSNGYSDSSINVFNKQYDYLEIVESPFDKDNTYEKEISKELFCEKLNINCWEIKINDIKRDETNRVEYIVVNNKKIKGSEIRKKLELRSTDFEIEINKKIKILTHGYGHGVGMSQYGANGMAKEGYSYEEILKYYYKNIEIADI